MTYLFLDIDGVLATNTEFFCNRTKFKEKNEWADKLGVPYPFNPSCVKVLNKILSECKVTIILSSDWKRHWNLEQLETIFKENGVIQSPVEKTPTSLLSFANGTRNRAGDIESFLLSHPEVTDWIVIDDLTVSVYIPEEFHDRIFLTTDSEGLKKPGLKQKIIKRLHKYDPKE